MRNAARTGGSGFRTRRRAKGLIAWASVHEPTRADVRRKRPDLVDRLLGGTRPIELPVGARDLLRVRRALGLRNERRFGEDLAEELDAELRGALEDDGGVVLGTDRKAPLRCDRTGVELGGRLVNRHAGLAVAGHDRPLDGGRAAPAREETGMDVEPKPLAEQLVRDEDAVAGHDDDAGFAGENGQPLGLLDRNVEILRRLLRPRRGLLPSPALRLVRPRG